MTTITREEVKAFIEQIESDLSNGWEAQIFELKLARIALASLDAEPVAWTSEGALAEVYCGETGVIGPKYIVGDIPLYRHAQPVPVVPDEMATSDDMNLYQKSFAQGYNACRNAMLQGVEQPQNARQNIPENIPDGNSPAIPDDWVMVPKEPTQAMIKAWLSEVANFRGHAAGYRAALEAAPQLEVNRG